MSRMPTPPINNRQNRLQDCGCLGPAYIDIRNEKSCHDGYGKPRSIYLKAFYGIEITCQKIGIYIRDNRRQCTGFKADDADVAQNDGPRADKRTDRAHGFIAEDVFAATLGHGRCQFSIRKTYKKYHQTTNGKPCHTADDAAAGNPIACRYDPAPSNHGAKGEDENVPCT